MNFTPLFQVSETQLQTRIKSQDDFSTTCTVLASSFTLWCRLQKLNVITVDQWHNWTSQPKEEAEQKFPKNFQFIHTGAKDQNSQVLGAGKFAIVYGKGPYAYKIVRFPSERRPETWDEVRCNIKELCFFHSLQHPRIISVLRSQVVMQHGLFHKLLHEMPKCESTLEDYIAFRRFQSFEDFKSMFRGIAEGFAYLHEKDIVHGDVKPANVLISQNRPYLTDFSLSFSAPTEDSAALGSLYWRAPETMCNQEYLAYSDVWGFAMLLVDAMYGCFYVRDVLAAHDNDEIIAKLPYLIGLPGPTNIQFTENHAMFFSEFQSCRFDLTVVARIHAHSPQWEIETEELEDFRNFITETLVWHGPDRLTFAEILTHPFFGGPKVTPLCDQPSSLPLISPVSSPHAEVIHKWVKYYYFETFHHSPPVDHDWLVGHLQKNAMRVIDQLSSLQATYDIKEVVRAVCQTGFFLSLNTRSNSSSFESRIFLVLHLLAFQWYVV